MARAKLTDADLDRIEAAVRAVGPYRVVINANGESLSASGAARCGIAPDVAWVRKDGWTLGAPADLRDVAYRLWADSWVREIDLASADKGTKQ